MYRIRTLFRIPSIFTVIYYLNYSFYLLFYIEQDLMEKIGMASKRGIAMNKLLIPISLINSIEQMMGRPYTNESFPEVS